MHIFHIMLGRRLGGLERAFVTLSNELAANGHRVTCVVTPKSEITPELRGCHILELRNRNAYDPLAIVRLTSAIKRQRPDILVTHGRRAATLTYRANRLWRGGVLPGGHGLVAHLTFLHSTSYAHLRLADHIIAVSIIMRARAVNLGIAPTKISHVPNIVHTKASPLPARPADTRPAIGFLGRFVEKKGVDCLLHASARLRAAGISHDLVLAGDGPLRGELERLAGALDLSDHVRFLGWVSDLAAFFSSIDVLAVPSRVEPFGIVLLETFAYGRPVVATKTDGPYEVIEAEKSGLLVEIEDIEGLAEALQRVLSDKTLAAQLSAGGLSRLQRYQPDTIVPQIEAIFAACIDEHRRQKNPVADVH